MNELQINKILILSLKKLTNWDSYIIEYGKICWFINRKYEYEYVIKDVLEFKLEVKRIINKLTLFLANFDKNNDNYIIYEEIKSYFKEILNLKYITIGLNNYLLEKDISKRLSIICELIKYLNIN